MQLWHGAGCDVAWWDTLAPHLTGFHVVAQDLPGHGRSLLKLFTTSDALADADAVTAELGEESPIVVGHSLGGYAGLRYAATRECSGWIGLDGPFAVVYPWEHDDPGLPESVLRIGREIRVIDVARDFAAIKCPAMLVLCSIAADPIEERLVPALERSPNTWRDTTLRSELNGFKRVLTRSCSTKARKSLPVFASFWHN